MAVKRTETAVVFFLLTSFIALVGWVFYSIKAENEARDAPARAAGFGDASDMTKARSQGFLVSTDWKAEKQRLADLDDLAKAQAEVKAEKERQQAEAAQTRIDAAKAQMKAVEDTAKQVRERRFQEGMIYARVLKKSMKNPDSFKLETVIRNSDGVFCYDYRATNSFNAVIPGHAFVGAGKSGTSDQGAAFVPLWNRYCGHLGEDFGTIVYALNNGW
jgi:hypothetical protein